MDQSPPEVLHQIFSMLSFQDVAALRRCGSKYASIGTEYLTNQLRFHISDASLSRLKDFSEHNALRQHIKTIVLEGHILADIDSENLYSSHFKQGHHIEEMPQPPANPTPRANRKYKRDLVKWEAELTKKYERYRQKFGAQQEAMNSIQHHNTLVKATAAFPKLENVEVNVLGACQHLLSCRFLESLPLTCEFPVHVDSSRTAKHIRRLLFPKNRPLLGLKSVKIDAMDPRMFSDPFLQPKLAPLFNSLRKIDLTFRLSAADRLDLPHGNEAGRTYKKLLDPRLNKALSSAKNLQDLTVNFNDGAWRGHAVNVRTILGDTVWPELEKLDIDSIRAHSDYLIAALTRQPALQQVGICNVNLRTGAWSETIEQMRAELHLAEFMARGVLEDGDNTYYTQHILVDLYIDDKLEVTMSEILDDFVTGFVDDNINPLELENFDDPEDLYEEFGPPWFDDEDSDSMPDLSDVGEDSSMPDLSDMDEDAVMSALPVIGMD